MLGKNAAGNFLLSPFECELYNGYDRIFYSLLLVPMADAQYITFDGSYVTFGDLNQESGIADLQHNVISVIGGWLSIGFDAQLTF
jgi:hypothetical protein